MRFLLTHNQQTVVDNRDTATLLRWSTRSGYCRVLLETENNEDESADLRQFSWFSFLLVAHFLDTGDKILPTKHMNHRDLVLLSAYLDIPELSYLQTIPTNGEDFRMMLSRLDSAILDHEDTLRNRIADINDQELCFERSFEQLALLRHESDVVSTSEYGSKELRCMCPLPVSWKSEKQFLVKKQTDYNMIVCDYSMGEPKTSAYVDAKLLKAYNQRDGGALLLKNNYLKGLDWTDIVEHQRLRNLPIRNIPSAICPNTPWFSIVTSDEGRARKALSKLVAYFSDTGNIGAYYGNPGRTRIRYRDKILAVTTEWESDASEICRISLELYPNIAHLLLSTKVSSAAIVRQGNSFFCLPRCLHSLSGHNLLLPDQYVKIDMIRYHEALLSGIPMAVPGLLLNAFVPISKLDNRDNLSKLLVQFSRLEYYDCDNVWKESWHSSSTQVEQLSDIKFSIADIPNNIRPKDWFDGIHYVW